MGTAIQPNCPQKLWKLVKRKVRPTNPNPCSAIHVPVWGCPTTAMWVYRLGAEKAKRMLFTGDKIPGTEAEELGLIYKAVPESDLDQTVEDFAERMCSVPVNQLMMQKLMINQAYDNMGLSNTQMIATVFDGITRHSPEGLNFKKRAEENSWKEAVRERDLGTYDWTADRAINSPLQASMDD